MTTRQAEKTNYLNWPRNNHALEACDKADKPAVKKWLEGRSVLTGYCTNYPEGGIEKHEGTKPKNWRGTPLKTCEFIETCPCICHFRIDQMFEMMGTPRVPMNNPEYVVPVSTFVMPEPVDLAILGTLSVADGPELPDDPQRPSTVPPRAGETPSLVPAAPITERRGPSGRASKGTLEAQTWEAVTWYVSNGIDPVTPKLVSEWIRDRYKVPTPSTGAIAAVWDRWTKLKYATQAKKPLRFEKFLGEGTLEELLRMKAAAKRAKKQTQSAARRGFR